MHLIAFIKFHIDVGWNRQLLAIPPCIATAVGLVDTAKNGGIHFTSILFLIEAYGLNEMK